jgi:hypothetical protein
VRSVLVDHAAELPVVHGGLFTTGFAKETADIPHALRIAACVLDSIERLLRRNGKCGEPAAEV